MAGRRAGLYEQQGADCNQAHHGYRVDCSKDLRGGGGRKAVWLVAGARGQNKPSDPDDQGQEAGRCTQNSICNMWRAAVQAETRKESLRAPTTPRPPPYLSAKALLARARMAVATSSVERCLILVRYLWKVHGKMVGC